MVEAIRSGWVAPVGPALLEFEKRLASIGGYAHVTALSSATAALHLAVRLAGVERGDRVIISTFTFIAVANAVTYEGGLPVFVDSEKVTWNIDPDLLEERLELAIRKNERIKAVIITHLYGMPAQMDRIVAICKRFGVILIEDAAESLGSRISDSWLGGFGRFGVFSFNGNKIVTTSGGGTLICQQLQDAEKALHLSQQAKDEADTYHHTVLGYNYRLSNVLASLGISQLSKLEHFIERKRAIYSLYLDELGRLGVFDFLEEPDGYFSNRWLTTLFVKDEYLNRLHPNEIIDALKQENIEARRLWKPLHLQPLYKDCEYVGERVAESLFDTGLCLPSGVGLTIDDQQRVVANIVSLLAARGFLK